MNALNPHDENVLLRKGRLAYAFLSLEHMASELNMPPDSVLSESSTDGHNVWPTSKANLIPITALRTHNREGARSSIRSRCGPGAMKTAEMVHAGSAGFALSDADAIARGTSADKYWQQYGRCTYTTISERRLDALAFSSSDTEPYLQPRIWWLYWSVGCLTHALS